ncbi:MAG: AAA family ATPase, partial [Bacillota bacterium]
MIPVALRLRNFLSYGEDVPPLDFTEFEVACLSGQNGHGKSAILDAITWALWGEGRKASGHLKAYDGLLRLGQSEMEVELVFDLEGERYRVWRRYKKKAKGGDSSLEFQVLDGESNAYIPLTTGSIAETQGKINQFLRMDYTTFINSAFILQGRADEFTRQSATRRKQILFEILGLDRYEELAKKAKEHRDQAEQQRVSLQARLDLIERELRDEPAWREQKAALESELERLGEQVAVLDAELTRLQERRAELMAQQTRLRELVTEIQRVQRDQADLGRAQQQVEVELKQDEALAAQQEKIMALYSRYQELTASREEWLACLREHNVLEGQAVSLEKTIALERSSLERSLQAACSRMEELQRVIRESTEQLADEEQVLAGHAAWQQAKAAEQEMQGKWQAERQLVEQRAPLERVVQQAERMLAMELARDEAQLKDEVKRAAEQARWQTARDQASALLTHLAAIESEREQVRERGT